MKKIYRRMEWNKESWQWEMTKENEKKKRKEDEQGWRVEANHVVTHE